MNNVLDILTKLFRNTWEMNLGRIKVLETKDKSNIEKSPMDKVTLLPHIHDYISFFCILEGTCCVKLKDKNFIVEKDDLCIIPPNQLHQIVPYDKKKNYSIIWFAIDDISSRIHISSHTKENGYKVITGVDVKEGNLVKNNLKRIISELTEKEFYYEWIIKIYLAEIFILLIRKVRNISDKKSSHKIWYKKLMSEAIDFIKNNYMSDIMLDNIAGFVRLTPNYFSSLFKQYTGMNVSEYLMRFRVNRAKKMLDGSKLSIKEISELVGYSDQYYFSRIFKKLEGISPKQYRCL